MESVPYETLAFGPLIGHKVVLKEAKQSPAGLYSCDGVWRPIFTVSEPIGKFEAGEVAQVTAIGMERLFVRVRTSSGSEGWIFWAHLEKVKE